MIIVEGADCVGKSTLCKALFDDPYFQKLGFIISHFSRLPEGFMCPDNWLERMTQKVIQDRFHISEPIYAPFNTARGNPKCCPDDFHAVHAKLRSMETALVVVLTAGTDLITERVNDPSREKEMFPLENIISANQNYTRYIDGTLPGNWPMYDHTLHFHSQKEDDHQKKMKRRVRIIKDKYESLRKK